jgi:aminoglycoside phosphotransferase (APT) family kinase protein
MHGVTDTPTSATDRILSAAAQQAGVNTSGAEIIRDGSNVMYRLPGGIVARVGRPGSADTAEREVRVSRWLADLGVSVTRVVSGLTQPVMVDDRPITWWVLLPEHRPGTPAELGEVLRTLHGLPVPTDLRLPTFDPFDGLTQRTSQDVAITEDDRAWLTAELAELRERYRQLSVGPPSHVIHGDAWQGNIAVAGDGVPVLLDLERVSGGHPEWDLISLAVDYTDFARLTAEDYQSFVDAYGTDVTTALAFPTFARIQELRWLCFAISKSATSTTAAAEVRHRIACLRGDIPRPWTWTAF